MNLYHVQKKNHMFRISKLLLCFALLYFALIVNVKGESGESAIRIYGDYTFYVNENNLAVITDYAGSESDVKVPDSLGGYPVGEIEASAFLQDKDKLQSVYIPETIQMISVDAFEECAALKKLTVSPDSPTYASIDNILYRKEDKRLVICPKGLNNSELKIPEGIEIIGGRAFADQHGVYTIILPGTLKKIEDYAFESSGVSEVKMNAGLQEIGEYAFNQCKQLSEITIPKSIKEINTGTFYECSNLSDVLLSEGLEKIGQYAFYNCDISEIKLPGSLQAIDVFAFGLTWLEEIEIPPHVTEIGQGAFYGCTGLKQVNVSEESEKYASPGGILLDQESMELVWYPYSEEEHFDIPDGIRSIGGGAFAGNKYLKEIVFPDSVCKIGDFAFNYCDNLEKLVINEGLESIEEGAFADCLNLKEIYIPASVVNIGDNVFWNNDPDFSVTGEKDSAIIEYAKSKGIPYYYTDSNDWLLE